MSEFNKTFTLESNLLINIKRCRRDVFHDYKLIPLKNSAFSYFSRVISRKEPLILPKLYAALTCLTGPDDEEFDDSKGSYSFTFELEVQKNENLSRYFLNIMHYRSFIDFLIYQIVPKENQKDSDILHQPNSELFSESEINFFCPYFCNYALGYLIGFGYIPKPFVKCSDSNLLLFGYFQDEYFIESYEKEEQYHADKKTYYKSIS
jgi:hypothetical protein